MKFIFLDDPNHPQKATEIEQSRSLTVSEAIEECKVAYSIDDEIVLFMNGTILSTELINSSDVIEVRLKSSLLSAELQEQSEDTTMKKRKLNEPTISFIRMTETESCRSIIQLLNELIVRYNELVKLRKNYSAFFKLAENKIQTFLKQIDTQKNEIETDIFLEETLRQVLKCIEAKPNKFIRCIKIISRLINVEICQETQVWVGHQTGLLNCIFQSKGSKNILIQLSKSIKSTTIKLEALAQTIKPLDQAIKKMILLWLDVQPINTYFVTRGHEDYIIKATSLLESTYSSRISSIVSSGFLSGRIIIYDVYEETPEQRDLKHQIGIFLLFLHELYHILIKSTDDICQSPESVLFGGFLRYLDDESSNKIYLFFSNNQDFKLSDLENHKPSHDSLIITKRQCELERDIRKRQQLKEILIAKKSRNKPNLSKTSESSDLCSGNQAIILQPLSSDTDFKKILQSMVIEVQANFCDAFKVEVLCLNLDNLLIPILHYTCKDNRKSFYQLLNQSRVEISKKLLNIFNDIYFSKTNSYGIPVTGSLNYSLALARILKKLLRKLSSPFFCSEGENCADIMNFKEIWNLSHKVGFLELLRSFECPKVLQAINYYRFELLNEIFDTNTIDKLKKNAAFYLFKDHEFVHSLQNGQKTLESLGVIKSFSKTMKNPIVRNSYSKLKNFEDYDNILEKALNNTFIFELPECFYGKTLLSTEIVLGNFKNYDKNKTLLHGGLLYEFIHEYAHFLQRCKLKTLEDVEKYTTPDIHGQTKEAGERVEKVLFGTPLRMFLPGAKFLLNLPYCNSSKEMCKKFKKANAKHDDYLTLRSMNSDRDESLEIKGICGMKMRKMYKNPQYN